MTEVKSGADAITIANSVARNAGLAFYTISEAKMEGDKWLVKVNGLGTIYQATISVTSGAVTEWKQIFPAPLK